MTIRTSQIVTYTCDRCGHIAVSTDGSPTTREFSTITMRSRTTEGGKEPTKELCSICLLELREFIRNEPTDPSDP